MTEEQTYPIAGPGVCPKCGHKERIGQGLIDQLKQNGNIDNDAFPNGLAWSVPLHDQNKPIMVSPLSIIKPKIPVLSICFDVCANPDCLYLYITKVNFTWEEINIQMPPPQMPPQGPNLRDFFPHLKG